MRKTRYTWKPLVKATCMKAAPPELVAEVMRTWGVDEAEAIRRLDEDAARCEFWVNDLYQVEVRRHEGKLVQLNIRRRDGGPILRDWRHFQQIKNELVGEECEAIELYPAESRKVDTSNKFHLWAIADPTFRFPIGFKTRDVQYEDSKVPGMRQRPL